MEVRKGAERGRHEAVGLVQRDTRRARKDRDAPDFIRHNLCGVVLEDRLVEKLCALQILCGNLYPDCLHGCSVRKSMGICRTILAPGKGPLPMPSWAILMPDRHGH